MEEQAVPIEELINAPDFEPERYGARFWYEQYLQQRQRIGQLEEQIGQLQEMVHQLQQRTSDNSSQPPSQDGYKKGKPQASKRKKREPKYGHPGTTCNGFGWVDHRVELTVQQCPECGTSVERVGAATVARQQVAELVSRPVEVWEYERPLYQCGCCRWQGRSPFQRGVEKASVTVQC